jgi:oxalate decarboxylase/phosphoglucose isomerase-like protein (cupin superfamily)
MSMGNTRFVTMADVDTLELPWGKLNWLSEPKVTGSQKLTTGVVVLEPGQGHDRHNHPGCEEIIYVLEGQAEQFVEHPDGKVERKRMAPGELVHVPADYDHGTLNVGVGTLKLLVVYEIAGPEALLRELPDCIVHPPARDTKGGLSHDQSS